MKDGTTKQSSGLPSRSGASDGRVGGLNYEPAAAEPKAAPNLAETASPPKWRLVLLTAAAAAVLTGRAAAADMAAPAVVPRTSGYDWTGFYVGAHIGDSWGKLDWRATSGGAEIGRGSFNEDQTQIFNEWGSWIGGLQGGYNFMLQNRIVIGAEADVSLSTFQNYAGITRGNAATNFEGGFGYFSHNVYNSGTVRARVGYAPSNWMVYATGGLAWSTDQLVAYDAITGGSGTTYTQRLGWAAGGGIEGALIPHWTVRAEYLYNDFGKNSVTLGGDQFTTKLSEQQVRVGVNYMLNDGGATPTRALPQSSLLDPDKFAIHGQSTTIWQGALPFSAAHEVLPPFGKDMPHGGEGRETSASGLYLGYKLWSGAEVWFNPEIEQGLGLGNTFGIAQFPSDGAYRIGQAIPYVRVQQFFIRQEIDLGGQKVDVPAGLENFADTQTSDRLVLTVGRIQPLYLLNTNSYNNPNVGTLNWAFAIPLSWDYGGDAWVSTYGALAEWYKGDYTLRVGVFDAAPEPDGGTCVSCYGLSTGFQNFNVTAEIEHRHELWGQPGKIKVDAYFDRGDMASLKDAIAWGIANNTAPDVAQVRSYRTKPGATFNIEQQIVPGVGVFLTGGWMYGGYEVYESSDVQRTLAGGVQFLGTLWGRPNDQAGLSASAAKVSNDYLSYFEAGGQGAVVGGDYFLTHPGTEKVAEAYYNYGITASMNVGLHYQYVVNPAYDTQRGPVSIIGTHFHLHF